MPAQKPMILFFNPVRHALAAFGALNKVARTELLTSTSREGFFKDLVGKYQDVNAIYRTSASGAVSVTIPKVFRMRIDDVGGR